MAHPTASRMIDGRYRRLTILGEGTTATVWKVVDTECGELRAIKMLSERLAAHEAVRERFAREAAVTARLRHPNIVRVHAAGDDAGVPYIVMDLVKGGTLRERVEESGPLPARIACAVVQQALHALHYAHAQGVVHRDVKPNNIMITSDGTPRVVDFGIGRAGAPDPRFSTDPGSVLGTFGYMAPEQGIDSAEVDNRADIYAAGATLFAILTGRRPPDLHRAGEDPEMLAAVPEPLRPILTQACRYQPADRYGTAAEMGDQLIDVQHALPWVSPEEEATMFQRDAASRSKVVRQQIDFGQIAPPEQAADERRRRRREGRAAKRAFDGAKTLSADDFASLGITPTDETEAPVRRREAPVWLGALISAAVIGGAVAWVLL